MKSHGRKREGSNTAAMLASLMGKREKLQEDLFSVEKQVYELESSYLQDSVHFGTALKDFGGFVALSKSGSNLKRSRKLQPEDRIFSLSSITSPAAAELGVNHDDGRSGFSPGLLKGGPLPTNRQGRPKKGRTSAGPKDTKEIKPLSPMEFNDEDDTDMSSR
ncbi:hypothetical protein K2173_021560 [Erythroxylum novogranatense]|uniref:Chromatin modification-related protein MEAF6 n=1 Tax=Erythroxylum novogranatense TaxID=1862640 RepID=A0AAV8TNG1_9ROSI|nr:hypothetical protein K2173_021560 [Erythroxylum novogranatense]